MITLIRTILFLGLLIVMPNHLLLAGGNQKSGHEKVLEANQQLYRITQVSRLARQLEHIVTGNPEEHPLYKDMQEQWKVTVTDVLLPWVIPAVASLVSQFAHPHWYETVPYNLYNYDMPYTLDFQDLSPHARFPYLRLISAQNRAKAKNEQDRNTPKCWVKFLEKHKTLLLDFIKENQTNQNRNLLVFEKARDISLYNHQSALVQLHKEQALTSFILTTAASSLTLLIAKYIKPGTVSQVFMTRLHESLYQTIFITFLMNALYQTHKLKAHGVIENHLNSLKQDEPYVPITFPTLRPLNSKNFVLRYILLDLLHTYGLEYKNTVIASAWWRTTTQRVEQWLKSKINRYNTRKKRLARITQKLKLPFFLSTMPFITKLLIATYTSGTCINVESLKQLGIPVSGNAEI